MKKLLAILCLVLALVFSISAVLAEETNEAEPTPEYTVPVVKVAATEKATGWLYLFTEDQSDFHEVVLYWGGNDYTIATKDEAKAAYDAGEKTDRDAATGHFPEDEHAYYDGDIIIQEP